jgi:hypothetical protein
MELIIFVVDSLILLINQLIIISAILSVLVVIFGIRCYNFKTGECICDSKYVGCKCNKENKLK